MSLKLAALAASMASLISIALGYYLRVLISLGKKGSVELQLKQLHLEAEEKTQKIVSDAEAKAADILRDVRASSKEKEESLKKTEERLNKKEDLLDRRQSDLDKEVESIKQKINEVRAMKEKVEAMEKQKQAELERIAKLTSEDARDQIISSVEKANEDDLMSRMRKLEQFGEEKLEEKAKEILGACIQRLAGAVPADMMSTTVTIPSDEVKGKIIGKEGRNIKAFERITGVELIVDDAPGAIIVSSFDPVRRQVAKIALERLVADGRIQPAKIEKEVEQVQSELNKIIKDKGVQAAQEVGVINIDPRVLQILGRLHFRTSYGQNVLAHSVEMAHVAGMIAEEIGANVAVAKAGALLHDIGKALDHEVEGTHVEIGRRILQKFGVSEQIVKAMEAHHEEYPYETVESRIVQTADAISGGRPGARRDSIENYLKRLGDLEAIATSFKGVEKAYALQAGREIRVFVTPADINDLEAKRIAREIALRIEKELRYPGEIRVTVIRETRMIEVAR